MNASKLSSTVTQIRNCTLCAPDLPLGPNPILQASEKARIVLVSQAPGRIAHEKGVAYKDPSGTRLRAWLGVTEEEFYDSGHFVIFPMGFCYPGKLGRGDAPPRPECAAKWHERLWANLPIPQLTILIGSYAQKHYLKNRTNRTLTATVKNFQTYLPMYWPIPHPSPLNNIWLRKESWFEEEVIPQLQRKVKEVLLAKPT